MAGCLVSDSSEDCRTFEAQEPSNEGTERFTCSICLDLVYKPIVQACGHIFCFWCAFKAMDVRKESHCPVCRRPYQYFPRVCELLHFVISKTTPVEYKRRGDEIRRAEEESQVFSPHFLKSPRQTWSPRSYDGLLTPREAASHCVNTSAEHISSADTSCPCKENDHEDWGDSGHMSDKPASAPALNSQKENGYADKRYTQVDSSFMDDKLTIDDFNCPSCNDLLYRPVVLNCGEVFCKSCLKRTTKAFYCPSCKSSNPGSSVHVCLELHQYLESAFPVDYNRRRLAHSAICKSVECTQLPCCGLIL